MCQSPATLFVICKGCVRPQHINLWWGCWHQNEKQNKKTTTTTTFFFVKFIYNHATTLCLMKSINMLLNWTHFIIECCLLAKLLSRIALKVSKQELKAIHKQEIAIGSEKNHHDNKMMKEHSTESGTDANVCSFAADNSCGTTKQQQSQIEVFCFNNNSFIMSILQV